MSRIVFSVPLSVAMLGLASAAHAQSGASPTARSSERVTVVHHPPHGVGRTGVQRTVLQLPPAAEEAPPAGVLSADAPTTRALDRRERTEAETLMLDDSLDDTWVRARPYGTHWAEAAWASGYWSGRLDERRYQTRRFNLTDMSARRERLYSAHSSALGAGLGFMKSGEYARAVTALTMAASLDNGDPAARIHLAQARIALGQYAEAGRTLRRAFQLQPKLVYVDLRLDRILPDAETFDRQIDHLASRASAGDDADVSFAWGAMEFQRGRYDVAWRAFRQVRPRDDATRAFLEITRPAVYDPATPGARSPQP